MLRLQESVSLNLDPDLPHSLRSCRTALFEQPAGRFISGPSCSTCRIRMCIKQFFRRLLVDRLEQRFIGSGERRNVVWRRPCRSRLPRPSRYHRFAASPYSSIYAIIKNNLIRRQDGACTGDSASTKTCHRFREWSRQSTRRPYCRNRRRQRMTQ
jgi:hypothetical protein